MQNWQMLHQNPAAWSKFLIKQEVIRAVRSFFEQRDYKELEAPILSPALPSEQYMNFLSLDLSDTEYYLIPSTERYNKMALAAGIGNHFVISKVFRGAEKIGPNHSPEFTMLEWYHLDGTYQDLMRDTEELIISMLKRIGKGNLINTYSGQEINFNADWPRFSVSELLHKHAGLELAEVIDINNMRQAVKQMGLLNNENLLAESSWQDLFELVFFNKVESNLPTDRPVFIYDYPTLLAPLALPNQDGITSQKVELYIGGKEVANGYTELRDGELLERNLREQYELRKAMGMPLAKFDEQLINALHAGIPPVAGIGMGIDRIVMILADAENISDINLFPTGQ